MKYHLLFLEYRPNRKCGVEPAVGAALITGATGLFGSAVSSAQSSSNVSRQLNTQARENQKNRDWMTAEAETARQWQHDETLSSQAYQTSERQASQMHDIDMQSRQAMYQSPVYQSEQLKKAGLNPAVYFGSQSSFGGSSAPTTGASGAPSTPNPAQVGSVSGLSPVSYQPLDLQIPALQQGISSLVDAATKSRVGGAQVKQLLAQAVDLEKNAEYKSWLTDYQKLVNDFYRQSFPSRLNKAFEEVEVLRHQKSLMEKQGNKFEKEAELAEATKNLNDQLARLHGAEAVKAEFFNNHLEELWQQESDLRESQTAANYASAEESRATAQNQRALASSNLFDANWKWENKESLLEEFDLALNQARNEKAVSDERLQQAKYATEQARVAASHAEELFWKDLITGYLDAGVNAIDRVTHAFTSFKNSSSWATMSKSRQTEIEHQYAIAKDKIKYQKERDSKVTHTVHYKKGKNSHTSTRLE